MTRNPRGRVAGGRRIAVCSVAALALWTFSVCRVPSDIAVVTATFPVALTDKQVLGSSPAAGVVMLFASSSPQQMYAGTAIVLTGDRIGLTNAHVVHGARQIIAHDPGAGRDWVVSVIGADELHDIAVIRLRGAAGLPTSVVGNSDRVRVGQAVVAVGNVGGSGTATASQGVITGLGRRVVTRDATGGSIERLRDMIETDAWVRPGDSGGPLLSDSGKVIGIDTAADGRHGYAIRMNDALAYAHALAQFSTDRLPPGARAAADDQGTDQGTDLDVGPDVAPRPAQRPATTRLAAGLRVGVFSSAPPVAGHYAAANVGAPVGPGSSRPGCAAVSTVVPRRVFAGCRMAAGALCTGQGLRLLLALPAAVSAQVCARATGSGGGPRSCTGMPVYWSPRAC